MSVTNLVILADLEYEDRTARPPRRRWLRKGEIVRASEPLFRELRLSRLGWVKDNAPRGRHDYLAEPLDYLA